MMSSIIAFDTARVKGTLPRQDRAGNAGGASLFFVVAGAPSFVASPIAVEPLRLAVPRCLFRDSRSLPSQASEPQAFSAVLRVAPLEVIGDSVVDQLLSIPKRVSVSIPPLRQGIPPSPDVYSAHSVAE